MEKYPGDDLPSDNDIRGDFIDDTDMTDNPGSDSDSTDKSATALAPKPDSQMAVPATPVEVGEWADIVNQLVEELNGKELPDKVVEATELLLAGYPIYKAAKKIGSTTATIRRWLTMYPTMAAIVANGKRLLSKWRMAKLEQQFLSALEVSQEVLDTALDGEGVNPRVLTVVAAQSRYIIGLFAGQKIDVTVTHELGETVMKAKTDALDYLAERLADQITGADMEPVEAVYKIVDSKPDDDGPMLDEEGNSPFGKIGELDTKEEGTTCHSCGRRLKNLAKHILTQHSMGVEEYEILYMLPEGSVRQADGYEN
jgi:hypothetical protein